MSPPDPGHDPTRRDFLKQTTGGVIGLALSSHLAASGERLAAGTNPKHTMNLTLTINGQDRTLKIDPRATLLDTLREQAGLTGSKKGCDRGECGACTVHLDGRRVLSCMTLALKADGRKVTTIEGLAQGEQLHPLQAAFIEHDALQCGYCTPGQIMSGVACIREGHAQSSSQVAEFMSGNLCRCAAYPQIRAAILDAAKKGVV